MLSSTLRRALACAVVIGLSPLASQTASAALNFTGAAYSQNFDSLPISPENASLGASPAGWTDDNAAPGAGNFSIVGWYLYHPILQAEGGFNGRQRVRIGAGTVGTGSFMSYGASTNTERALGSLASTTLVANGAQMYIALRLTNTSADTYDSFTLAYDGEQWRDGGAAVPNAQKLDFEYSLDPLATVNTGVYTAADPLDFTSPVFVNTGAGAAVDGNVAGKVAISNTVTGINWAPGTDIWLRWADNGDAGNDHALAIDNVNFTATPVVPEPTSFSLLAVPALLALKRRRAR